jgi:hypothetical protein
MLEVAEPISSPALSVPRRAANRSPTASTRMIGRSGLHDGGVGRVARARTELTVAGDRGFESTSLQRRVTCEPNSSIRAPNIHRSPGERGPGPGHRSGCRSSFQRGCASFRQSLAVLPLRFASASPPSGCTGDFHPQTVGHVRHTAWLFEPPPRAAAGLTSPCRPDLWLPSVRRPEVPTVSAAFQQKNHLPVSRD